MSYKKEASLLFFSLFMLPRNRNNVYAIIRQCHYRGVIEQGGAPLYEVWANDRRRAPPNQFSLFHFFHIQSLVAIIRQ